jgi:hypothetical protein
MESAVADVATVVEKHAADWHVQLVGKQGDNPVVTVAIGGR